MFRHFVPSRWLHPLAPLMRLSLVDLPSANNITVVRRQQVWKNRIPKIRPLTGRNVRKVNGLFLSQKSKKEVNHNDKTENSWTAPNRKGTKMCIRDRPWAAWRDRWPDRGYRMFCPKDDPYCRGRLSGGGGKVPVYEAGQFTCSVCHGLYEGQHHLCPQYQEIPSGGTV